MDYDVDVLQLSPKFESDYPASAYPEIMYKLGRPYNCLMIDSHQDYFICVPFRSYINHNNAFLFQKSRRSTYCKSGLDYSKSVIIKDLSYIDSAKAVVDQDEYNEAMQNMNTIAQKALEYVDTYIGHVDGSAPIHEREFQRRYKFSTLKYFHDVLGLTANSESAAD